MTKFRSSPLAAVCLCLAYLLAQETAVAQLIAQSAPAFQLTPGIVTISTDLKSFQGEKPKDASTISYSVELQSFLGTGTILEIPAQPLEIDAVKKLAANPYITLIASLNLDKLGRASDNVLLLAPGYEPGFAKTYDPKYNSGIQVPYKIAPSLQVHLLLAIKRDDLLFVFYRLLDEKSGAKVDVCHTFQNVDGLYLTHRTLDSDPMPHNVLATLQTKGDSAVTISQR